MEELKIKRKKLELSDYVFRRAKSTDVGELIDYPFKLFDGDTGKLLCLYIKPEDCGNEFDNIFNACLKVKYSKNYRTNGLSTTSRIFGFNPRNAIRKDYCSTTSLFYQQPKEHEAIARGALLVSKYYAVENPVLYDEHLSLTNEKVVKDFRFENVPFTSGIINENNPLCYHFDSGNFKKVWSAMIVFKKDIEGGYLSLPEFGISVKCSDNSIFYFDGQGMLHGVTPIVKKSPEAKRYSIVYYSLQQLWNCEPLRNEVARARMRRQKVEENRMNKVKVV